MTNKLLRYQNLSPAILSMVHRHTTAWDACLLCMLIPEGLAVGVGVLEAHLLKLTAPIQLVVASVRLLSEILHVHSDQHLPQLHKVTMVLILNYKKNKQRRGGPSAAKLQRGSRRHTGCLLAPPSILKEALTRVAERWCQGRGFTIFPLPFNKSACQIVTLPLQGQRSGFGMQLMTQQG